MVSPFYSLCWAVRRFSLPLLIPMNQWPLGELIAQIYRKLCLMVRVLSGFPVPTNLGIGVR
jgi:hypothetical protein